MLESSDSIFNKTIEKCSVALIQVTKDLQRLEKTMGNQFKDEFSYVKVSSKILQTSFDETFHILTKIRKEIFKIIENIAQKEISKDPIDFIKRESSRRFPSVAINNLQKLASKVNLGETDKEYFNEEDESPDSSNKKQ